MDRFIERFAVVEDGDLNLCMWNGVAWQADRTNIVSYDEPYYQKCASYEDQEIAQRINEGRIDLVRRHFGDGPLCDVGIGSGEFLRKRGNTWGQDINPVAIESLKRSDRWAPYLCDFLAFSFWDVIEHIENPEDVFRQMPGGSYLFASLPIFENLWRIRDSKHYRPGEHLYYWTEHGFVAWMALHGFELLEADDFETRAGREAIKSFAFCRLIGSSPERMRHAG